MPGGRFRGISIREEVYVSVEIFIRAHPEMGYRNVSQFVTDAVRERLLELKARLGAAQAREAGTE